MRPDEVIVPSQAFALVKPEESKCLFSSIGQWNELQGTQCLYHVPADAEIIAADNGGNRGLIALTCIQRVDLGSTYVWDPLSVTQIEFPFRFESRREAWAPMFTSLLKEWNSKGYKAEIVVSKGSVFEASKEEQHMGNRVILLGLRSRLAAMEIELRSIFALQQDHFVDSVDCKATSLIPLLAGNTKRNWEYISRCLNTDVIFSDLGLTGFHYPDKLFVHSTQQHCIECAKQCLEVKINAVIEDGIHATTISNLSPLKLIYMKAILSSKILDDLMFEYPSFIKIGANDIQIQSYSSEILSIVKKKLVRGVLSSISEVRLWFTKRNEALGLEDKMPFLLQVAARNRVIIFIDQKDGAVTIVGSHASLQRTYTDILAERFEDIQNVRFSLELDTIYKDFISGKKNGKLTKIMDQTVCAISLENDPSGNMLVVLQGEKIPQIGESFGLLLQELPCEESFFIPEAYHRPVIGAGGSVIQTIMRKYNVFIQFSNSFQLPQQDWNLIRYENVIIRCPSKNRSNILAAKEQLLKLAEQYSQMRRTVTINFAPSQYKYLVSCYKSLSFISDIEKAHTCYISFPHNLPSDYFDVVIQGSDDGPELAANDFVSKLGKEINLVVKDPISKQEFSAALLLPLNLYKVQFSIRKNSLSLAYGPELQTKQLESVLFLIESYFQKTSNEITSSSNASHAAPTSVTTSVGKKFGNNTHEGSQSSMKEYSQVRT